MPKIISRAHISSSSTGGQLGDLNNLNNIPDSDSLHQAPPIYFCLCGGFLITLDRRLNQLPRRRTDQAYILIKDQIIYRLNSVPGPVALLKRERGNEIEKQYRLNCPSCNLWVGYRCAPDGPGDETQKTYLLSGACRDEEEG